MKIKENESKKEVSYFKDNRVARKFIELNKDFDDATYYSAVRDALYELGKPSTNREIKDKMFETLGIVDRSIVKSGYREQKDTTVEKWKVRVERGMNRVLSVQEERGDLFRVGKRLYWLSDNPNEKFPDNMNYDSKTFPKIAKMIVFDKTNENMKLSPKEKLKISMPYWIKSCEKLGRVLTLHLIATKEFERNNNEENSKKLELWTEYLKIQKELVTHNLQPSLVKQNLLVVVNH